jgi:hypothetical protein
MDGEIVLGQVRHGLDIQRCFRLSGRAKAGLNTRADFCRCLTSGMCTVISNIETLIATNITRPMAPLVFPFWNIGVLAFFAEPDHS